jgi:hypothetical protein
VLLPKLREPAAGAVHVPANNDVADLSSPSICVAEFSRLIARSKGRISALLYLPPFRRHRVHLVPLRNLARAQVFGNRSHPGADALAIQIKRRTVSFDPARSDVGVRVFGIKCDAAAHAVAALSVDCPRRCRENLTAPVVSRRNRSTAGQTGHNYPSKAAGADG